MHLPSDKVPGFVWIGRFYFNGPGWKSRASALG
jgi:hypothetical protein